MNDNKFEDFNQPSLGEHVYKLPKIGLFEKNVVEGINEVESNGQEKNILDLVNYLPYLEFLGLSAKDLAKGRYYMMFRRFNRAQEDTLDAVKYMSYSRFYKLVSAYEQSHQDFEKEVENFINSAELRFNRRYIKLKVNKPDTYNRLLSRYLDNLSMDSIERYIARGIEIVRFIRDNLLTEKEREQHCKTTLSTLEYLFEYVEECYSLTQYPQMIKYKHLKKKLNFRGFKLNLDRLLNSNDYEIQHKAYKCLLANLPKCLSRVKLLRHAFGEIDGCKYLAKAYGSQQLANMILDLEDIRSSYLEKLISCDSLADISLTSLQAEASVLVVEILKLQNDYEKFLGYIKIEGNLDYMLSQHRDCRVVQEEWL